MVGGHVKHHGYPRPRPLDGLQLEARQLQNDPVPGRDLIQPVQHRIADVAAHKDRTLAGLQDAANQRGGRGLPVGAGDADDRRRAKPEEEIHLAGDWDVPLASQLEQLGIPGHARAGVYRSAAIEHSARVAAQLQVDADRKRLDVLLQFGPRTQVADAGDDSAGRKISRHSHAAATEPDDQRHLASPRQRRRLALGHALGPRWPHAAKRATQAEASAATAPAPQNESAIRFSDQPSRWNV